MAEFEGSGSGDEEDGGRCYDSLPQNSYSLSSSSSSAMLSSSSLPYMSSSTASPDSSGSEIAPTVHERSFAGNLTSVERDLQTHCIELVNKYPKLGLGFLRFGDKTLLEKILEQTMEGLYPSCTSWEK